MKWTGFVYLYNFISKFKKDNKAIYLLYGVHEK